MTRPLAYLFVLIFMAHQAFGLWMNHARLAQINLSIGDDVELICTGNEMKWISISLSMQASEFVFVDAPTETHQIDADQLCPDVDARDNDSSGLITYISQIAHFSAYVATRFATQQAELLTHKFTLSIPRAPPLNSLK